MIATKTFLVLLSLTLTWPAAECRGETTRLLVPAYGNPCDLEGDQMWDELTATAAAIGDDLVVILNPNSGPGDGVMDPCYLSPTGQGPFIDYRNAGGVAIGYIRTLNAQKPLAEAQAEVDLYFNPAYWNGAGVQIDGIFFDEVANDLQFVGYYQALRDYVRTRLASALVVGNPGTTFLNNTTGQTQWTVADYVEAADLLVTFENDIDEYLGNYTPPSWLASYPAERFGHIVYEVPTLPDMLATLALARGRKAGWIYITDDLNDETMNPYNVLATYWAAQVDAAQGLIFSDGFESGDLGAWIVFDGLSVR
ncbi:MAG: spherulation-specific family 4 protein [Acidobacteriota bacterium]